MTFVHAEQPAPMDFDLKVELRLNLKSRSCPASIMLDNDGFYLMVQFGAAGCKYLRLPDDLEDGLLHLVNRDVP